LLPALPTTTKIRQTRTSGVMMPSQKIREEDENTQQILHHHYQFRRDQSFRRRPAAT
jgi:hypothetical protein